LKIEPEAIAAPNFDLLAAVGFSKREIEAAKRPHLRRDDGGRRAASEGRALTACSIAPIPAASRQALSVGGEPHPMMAASQPFISGAISKTINMPNDATVEVANPPICCPGSSR